jgi:hypothetical protein
MKAKPLVKASLVGACIVTLDLLPAPEAMIPWVGERTAEAVVGMPFTPVSYGGMARRTSRRTARRTTRRNVGYYDSAPGCSGYGTAYSCSGAQYTPAYNGTNVVYVQE